MLLLAAGLLEVVWAFTMKLSQGFTRLAPTVLTLLAMLASFGLLSISMRSLPLGTAYTVWTGVGAVGRTAESLGAGARAAWTERCSLVD
jgi:quaternary ammonium compound-resistance protein SugE